MHDIHIYVRPSWHARTWSICIDISANAFPIIRDRSSIIIKKKKVYMPVRLLHAWTSCARRLLPTVMIGACCLYIRIPVPSPFSCLYTLMLFACLKQKRSSGHACMHATATNREASCKRKRKREDSSSSIYWPLLLSTILSQVLCAVAVFLVVVCVCGDQVLAFADTYTYYSM